jgi:hypothetical protein
MPLQNPWVGYLSRSYQAIKQSIFSRVKNNAPEITDFSESNPLVILIGMFSGIAEMLGYYIDNMARETFVSTNRRFASAVKNTKLIDYRIKAAIPSAVDLLITLKDASNNDYTLGVGETETIPIGTKINSINGFQFLTIADLILVEGESSGIVGAQQKTSVPNSTIGVTNGSNNQKLSLGTSYMDGTCSLLINSITYLLQDTLGRSGPTDYHFIVDIDIDGIAYATLGDGTNGFKPASGLTVKATYYTTRGLLGNQNPDTIQNLNSVVTLNFADHIDINNTLASDGGTGYEDIDRIKRSAPLSIRTLNRAVTKQDFVDLAKLAPGVDKANLFFDCGKEIEIYISPVGGGIASIPLLLSTEQFLNAYKMVTTFLTVKPSGETYIGLDILATAKFRVDGVTTKTDIENALVEAWSYSNSDVNKAVRLSDIIALIDNLEKVDYLNISKLYQIPYARPQNSYYPLIWIRQVNAGSIAKHTWNIIWDGANMRLYKDHVFVTNIPLSTPYTDSDNIITFNITAAVPMIGAEWEFITYPYNEDIELDDYTIPIISLGYVNLVVNEQRYVDNI